MCTQLKIKSKAFSFGTFLKITKQIAEEHEQLLKRRAALCRSRSQFLQEASSRI
jgi:hypothetical protein